MRVFLYEFVTGGGTWGDPDLECPSGSLLQEGAAMLAALATDLASIKDVTVELLRETRLPELAITGCRCHDVASAGAEREIFRKLAADSDWTVVIAPELNGALLDRCLEVETAGGRLLGPGSEFVRIASDKQITTERLAAAGMPVPSGLALDLRDPLPSEFQFPAVVKPRFGMGSVGVQLIPSRWHWDQHLTQALHCPVGRIANPSHNSRDSMNQSQLNGATDKPFRLESFCPGLAASVAVLCGPHTLAPLPPCQQLLTDDGCFQYLGGRLPLPPNLSDRAQALALAAVAALPGSLGYIGVDLVLGEDSTGHDDRVIEVNPRLTTSYVGLRVASQGNLARAMLDLAEGKPVELSFSGDAVEFSSDGAIESRTQNSVGWH